MDDVPYDFIDRVFTKLTFSSNYQFNDSLCVQSPLWTEVERVYKKKVESYSVNIVLSNDGGIFYEILPSHPTFEKLTAADDRFIRITGLTICPAHPISASYHNRITNQLEFIRYLCRFELEDLDIRKTTAENQEIASMLEECVRLHVRNRSQIPSLTLSYTPALRDLLKHCLNSPTLQSLTLCQSGESTPSDFKDGIVAFVCRPNFRLLCCYFACLDMDCVRQIIAYWRSMEAPWKQAYITLLTMKQKEDLKSEIASMFSPTNKADRYEEIIGNFRLDVHCIWPMTKLTFTVIS